MLFLGLASFFAFGVVLVLVGANQTEIARDLAMSLADSGLLGASLSLGLGIGVTVAGPCVDRWPRRPLFVASTALTAVALLSVDSHMSYQRALLHVAAVGLGCGFYETLLNAATLDRYRERSSRALALLHAAATAGAVAGPAFVVWWAADGHWTRSFRALGGVYAALAALGACLSMPSGDAVPASGQPAEVVRFRSLAMLALCGIAFAYVGAETGLTLFSVAWATQDRGTSEAAGRAAISAFWLGLLVGRLALSLRRRAFGAPLLAACGVTGALILGLTACWPRAPLAPALFAVGLALGPVYPLMIAVTAREYPRTAGTATGLVAGAGALGGFILPWLAGVLGDACGIRHAILMLGLALCGIVVSAWVLTSKAQAN